MDNDRKLTNYRLEDMKEDITAIVKELREIRKSLAGFGPRIGKCESRIDTLYWLIGLAVPTTSAITGIIVSLIVN